MRHSRIRQHYEDPRSGGGLRGIDTSQAISIRPQMTGQDIDREVAKARHEWNTYMTAKQDLHRDWVKEVDFCGKEPNLAHRAEMLAEAFHRPKYKRHNLEATRLWTALCYWEKLAHEHGVSEGQNLAATDDPYWMHMMDDSLEGNPHHEKAKRQIFYGSDTAGYQGGGFRKRSSVVKMGGNPLGGGE